MNARTKRVAVVTGASRGIGKAVAEALAASGFDLALCARSKDELAKLKEALGKNGTSVEIYPLDVTDESAVRHMVDDTVERFGRIDLLFNNAGIFRGGTSEIALEDFVAMLDINLKAAFHFVSLIAPVMKQQKSGTIINISSRSGKYAKPGSGGYAASKFGLVGLNEALYRELSDKGIKVTAICPGWVDTEMATMSGLDGSDMIATADIVKTVEWLLTLSPTACVKEVCIEPPVQTN